MIFKYLIDKNNFNKLNIKKLKNNNILRIK